MEMSTEIGILLAYGFGILVLYLLGYLLLVPIKFLLKLLCNSLFGGVFILVINRVADPWDIHIPLNILSAILTGILGLPGIILLVVLRLIV